MQAPKPSAPPTMTRVLLVCLVPGDAATQSEYLGQLDEKDWPALMEQARLHKLGPMLHASLLRTGAIGCLPAPVRDELAANAQAHAARNLAALHQL
ncbi:MAG: nucleotidyltransferase family protein, partial [Nevskiales bacterium]